MSLLDLAERVEAAKGADRELDADIAVAQGWNPTLGCPAYTTSLDVAMTLVPEGLRWCVDTCGTDGGFAFVEDVNDFREDARSHKGKAATPALALTAASLRARHALAKEVG